MEFLQKINNNIKEIDKHIGYVDGVSTHLRDARFKIMAAGHMFGLNNEKRNVKEETVSHKIEGQES